MGLMCHERGDRAALVAQWLASAIGAGIAQQQTEALSP